VARDDSATDGPKIDIMVVGSLLDEAVNALTDGQGWKAIFPFIKSEHRIAIKVNAMSGAKLIIHEEVLDAIVIKLMGLGVPAGNIIVFDGDSNSSQISWLRLPSIKKQGVKVFNTSVIGFDENTKATFPDGQAVSLSRIITDCTYLINIPTLKDHGQSGITFSLKSHVGSIDDPRRIHREMNYRGIIIPETIAAINNLRAIKEKTRLIVGDGLFGIYQGGPGGNPQFAYNGLIVGTDPVAVDHVARTIIDEERAKHGLQPLVVSHIGEATRLGVGASPNDVKLIPLHRKKMG
jgi:uncharacterized protein (DUF362 family)